MTTIAWGMTTVGFAGLFVLCFRAPESDALGMKLLFGSLMVALCGVVLLIYATPEPIPQRAAAIAPIAGAPLVLRIDAAHAAIAVMPLRRLPVADSDLVLP